MSWSYLRFMTFAPICDDAVAPRMNPRTEPTATVGKHYFLCRIATLKTCKPKPPIAALK